jgi:catechol 2,3-dioxygenase-like lactoylglutathione lyase family enzyme
MRYAVTIDVPSLAEGLRFYCGTFGFEEIARPVPGYAVLRAGEGRLGLMQRAEGTAPAPGSPDRRRYARHWTPVHLDFHVAEFDSVLARALAHGALCEQRFDRPDRPPVAFLSDPFGHGFCLIGEGTPP